MSSRANRRATRGSARSRRAPARAATGGPRIPWIPVAVVVGVVAVVGVIAYLVWQSGKSASDDLAPARAAEADASTDLPGQWVDLATVYGGQYNDTAGHVQSDVDYANDCATNAAGEEVCNSNPPAGGPHWSGGCADSPADSAVFCGPATWGIYREPWDPETVVHNMEHGGVVLWYNTTDQGIISDLEDDIKSKLDDGDLIVMMPYPDMEAETIAVTSWSRIDKFPVSEYSLDRVNTFIDKHERRFNPEHF